MKTNALTISNRNNNPPIPPRVAVNFPAPASCARLSPGSRSFSSDLNAARTAYLYVARNASALPIPFAALAIRNRRNSLKRKAGHVF